MKKFLKEYLGLIAAVGLASGSLFAFNISTSIDNALQVIKTIRVTSDGTTTNPPFVTMDGSGKYVSIGTTNSGETLSVSGSVFAQDKETKFFVGNDGTSAFGVPVAGAYMGIDATASSGATANIVAYDTRAVDPNDGKLGINIATESSLGLTGVESRASLNTSKGESMDIDVEAGFDYSNLDQLNNTGSLRSKNKTEINMDPDNIIISAATGIIRTFTGNNGDYVTNYIQGSHIELHPAYLNIYGSGGFANMHFNSVLGLFGFAQNNPKNTIDIGGAYLTGTLGLRFSSRQNASGQILGINNSGDVITLGNINSFGGGGGPTGPWQYGAGSPQSAQIMSAGNSSNGSYAVVGGRNNIGNGYASSIIGGTQNVTNGTGSAIVGGADNTIHDSDGAFIGAGQFNGITGHNLLAIANFIGAGEGNIIDTFSGSSNFIGAGLDNIINSIRAFIGAGEHNTISTSAINASIIGGSGNTTSGALSFIGGGELNTVAGLYATIVGGISNIIGSAYGFVGGGSSNVLTVGALYSFVGGGQNNAVTDRYSSIVGGLNNVNQSEKSFIGGGENNTIDINNGLSAIVAGSGNIITSGAVNSFIGGGLANSIQNSFDIAANVIVGGGNNSINYGIAASIVGGFGNTIGGGGGMFVGGGSQNHADGDGNTIVGGSKNWAGSISGNSVQSFIGGGSENTTIDSSRTVVVGGEKNRIEEDSRHSAILGGLSNIITSSVGSWIGGGSGNMITASGDYTSIGGGFNNIVDNGPGSFIGGGHDNNIQGGGLAAIEWPNTIAGGAHNSALGIVNTIAGGLGNTANGTLFTIGGGNNNTITADGDGSTIAGGSHNSIIGSGYKSVIGGGVDNSITNGSDVVIGGGSNNTVSGSNSTIPGGNDNSINGDRSFAAGHEAIANTDYTFVWNGGYAPFSSTIANTFLVNAPNGVGINTSNTNSRALMVNGDLQASNYYSAPGNQGLTTTLTNIGGGGCDMVFENGLLVSTSGC